MTYFQSAFKDKDLFMKKYIIASICFLLFVIAVMAFLATKNGGGDALTQKQKQDALEKLLGRTPVLEEKKTSDAWISHKNQYVSFLYPEVARIYDEDDKSAMQEKSIFDSFHFGTDTPKLYGVVQVIDGGTTQNLSDIPGVLMREQQPDYQKSAKTIASFSGEMFHKNADTGVEWSVFFLAKGKEYSVVITGNNSQDAEDFFNRLVASLQIP